MMSMKTELLAICDHLVAAALNGAYQGLLVTVFVGLALRLLRRTNAASRHGIWLATLILVVCLLPAHYWRHALASDKPAANKTPLVADLGPQRVKARETEPAVSRKDEDFFAAVPEMSGDPVPEPPVSPVFAPRRIVQNHPASSVVLLEPRLPRITCLCLVCLWFITAGARMILLVWRLYQVRKLKARSLPAPQDLDDLFQSLRKKLGVNRPVRLGISPVYSSPIVVGFLHPEVLLSPTEAESINPAETEHILRHELAHVQRRDDWANLLQHCMQALMFFHPAVWWISRQLSLEREIACDDFVLEQVGKPRAYALTLASLAGRINRRSSVLAPGISTTKTHLQQRINMILDTQRNTTPHLARTRVGIVTSASALVAILALNFAPRLVLAGQTQTGPQNPSEGVTAPARFLEPDAPANPPSPATAGLLVERSQAPQAAGTATPDIGSGQKSGSQPLSLAPTPPLADVEQSGSLPRSGADGGYGAPVHGDRSYSSIEERLDRLERMVKSLLARQNAMSPDDNRDMESQPDQKNALPDDGKQPQLKELLKAREKLTRELKKLDAAINRIQRDKELLKQMQPQRPAPEPNANPNEN